MKLMKKLNMKTDERQTLARVAAMLKARLRDDDDEDEEEEEEDEQFVLPSGLLAAAGLEDDDAFDKL